MAAEQEVDIMVIVAHLAWLNQWQ